LEALIYTRNDLEYEQLRDALTEVSGLVDVSRDPLDGHGHYGKAYDIVIVALDGAKGMNEVTEWVGRFPDSKIVWITDDRDFAGVAIQKHICDFIVRPFNEERIKESLRSAVSESSRNSVWDISSR
jgi:DNA-binding NtrC family response regulator